MFTQQGPGGIYYSAVRTEPDMHPLIEMGASIAPYAIGYAALHKFANTQYAPDSQYSKLDVFQKRIRNVAELTPLGIGNTFRIPEYLSPYMSAKGLGLDIGKSILDPGQDVGRHVINAEYLTNSSTKNVLENILNKNAYSKISGFLTEGQTGFQLVYEQSLEGKGKSNLIFQQLEEYTEALSDGTKEVKTRVKTGTDIHLGSDFRLMNLNYGDSNYDFLEMFGKDKKINPAVLGFFQSLGLPTDTDYTKIFSNADGNKSKFALVSSTGGTLDNFGDFKKRSALLTAPLSSGINRFNRLLDATKNQIPILGDFVGRLSEATGLSLKTRPDAFYKQYASLGLKASKIGAVYLGLETVDHYRRNFGTVGNLVASAGIGMGVGHLYEKMSTEKKFGSGKVGMVAFAAQMLAPGFDKGIVEGLSSTMANIDIGRSMIGQMTGLSSVRRGIEGIMPGFTDYTTGLALGVGVATLSYSGFSQELLRRTEMGTLTDLDMFLKGMVPKKVKDRIGFVGQTVQYKPSDRIIRARGLTNILSPSNFLNNNASEDFKRLNPVATLLEENIIDPKTLAKYEKAYQEIIGETPIDNLSRIQTYKLERFFLDNQDIIRSMNLNIDTGRPEIMGLDFVSASRQLTSSKIHEAKFKFNDLNRSLLERIAVINETYSSSDNMFSSIMRKGEIFGAEMYHAFFGATLEGDVKLQVGGEILEGDYDTFAKNIFDAKPLFRRFGLLVAGTAMVHQLVTTGIFGSMDDASDLKEIYSGKKMIEVKAGRFWEGGGTPYEGNETRYFRPHQHALLMSQAREKSVWGDDTERFNPITKFLLKNFTYYLEEKNYYDRPYPVTGEAFSDVPILSSILKPTIGRLVKPRKLMHQEELTRQDADTGLMETAYLQEFGSSPEIGEIPPGVPKTPGGLMSTIGEIQYQQREIEGLTGYARNYMQKLFTGRETLGTRQLQMASASDMDSLIQDFWDMDLGGMAFTSEALRRVLPRPRGDIEKYNPIANTMPEYVPERFKRGDPYRSIPNGFARLPGEGYAALNPELKGIDPEDYPDIHKYKILADVAPTSRKTMQFKNNLMERRAAGITTEFENEMMDRVVEMHQKTLSKLNELDYHENAIKIPIISDIVSTAYKGAESAIRKTAAPLEYLIPGGFRPTQKLMGDTRSSIEIYEQERLYGTVNAFWDKHYRDWFRPAMYSAANLLGYSGKPLHVQQREDTNELFDKLNFYKFMKMAENAENIKDRNGYLKQASKTRMGVNPNGDALGLYLSLPIAERKFFNSFSQATGENRQRILEMIPEDQQKLYEAVWSRMDQGEKVDLSSPQSKVLVDETYLRKQMQEAEIFLQGKIPGPDWIGWHKDVDIEDIRIKYISNTAGEIGDHDVYTSQVRRISRRPYLEGSDQFLFEDPLPSRSSSRRNINRIITHNTGNAFSDFNITESNRPYNNNSATITYNDSRFDEMFNLTASNLRG